MNKLKGNKKINLLFEKGLSVKHFPFRVIYLEHEEVSWGVSVSKKAFNLAVDRNKIKRVLREGVKKHLLSLFEKNKKKYCFMVMYIDNKKLNNISLENGFIGLQKLVIEKLEL